MINPNAELFVNLRGPGGYIGCHSGGPRFDDDGCVLRSRWGAAVNKDKDTSHDPHTGTHRGHHVNWNVPYISIILALHDIGPGDGKPVYYCVLTTTANCVSFLLC